MVPAGDQPCAAESCGPPPLQHGGEVRAPGEGSGEMRGVGGGGHPAARVHQVGRPRRLLLVLVNSLSPDRSAGWPPPGFTLRWWSVNMTRPQQAPVVNVVAAVLVLLSVVPIYVAQRLSADAATGSRV